MMIQLDELLAKIHQKPGMYIGGPSISNLFMFLCGYQYCQEQMGIPETSSDQKFAQFQPWLQERFGVRTSASWAKIILLYASDECHAFEMFFELLSEFFDQSIIVNNDINSEKILLANNPQLQKILDKSRQSLREECGLTSDQFWELVDQKELK